MTKGSAGSKQGTSEGTFDADQEPEAEPGAALEEPDEAVIADAEGAAPVDDFDADDDDDPDAVVALDKVLQNKQGNARQLAIRRALEERREARRMKEDLDYLDLDD